MSCSLSLPPLLGMAVLVAVAVLRRPPPGGRGTPEPRHALELARIPKAVEDLLDLVFRRDAGDLAGDGIADAVVLLQVRQDRLFRRGQAFVPDVDDDAALPFLDERVLEAQGAHRQEGGVQAFADVLV